MSAIRKVALFGVAFFVSIAGIDAYLQLARIQTPMETRIDPHLGPVYIPNKPFVRFSEGFFMGSVNEYGYMGPPVPPKRIGAEHRILLLGDSYVLGHTVLPRHHFGHFLEERLARATGVETHAMNFGRADSSLENMYQYYQDLAGTFDHDIALFFLSQRDLMPWAQGGADLYPAVGLESATIVINRDFQFSEGYRLSKSIEPLFTRSAVSRLGFNAFKVITQGKWQRVVMDKLWPAVGPETEDANSPNDIHIENLTELKRAVLRELAKDPRNILVVQAPLTAELLSEVADTGLPIIDLGAFLERERSQGRDPYFWPVTRTRGHWNHAAHPLIGEFLADEILAFGRLGKKGSKLSKTP